MVFFRKFMMGILVFAVATAAGQDTSYTQLTTIVVSANKLKEKRIESPVAISILSPKTIDETKAQRIDFLLNKVSGVYMPTIGNEQHMMSIRQPISLKGLYLYLEDGMPIRTSGLFSSNALIEMNSSNIHSIEIIKGPASALYGAEAIGGVVNILTTPVPSKAEAFISTQITNTGFKKLDLSWGAPTKTGGWMISAAWTDQKNGITEYSDFNKKALSVKRTFKVNEKLKGYQNLQYINYYTQMTGSLDSIKFFQKNFGSQQSFTFRKIDALRFRQNLDYNWNTHSNTTFNFMYRNNTMDQNPAYLIASTANPTKFKGQVNSNHFDAYVLDLQHVWSIPRLSSKIMLGGYWDITNQNLIANYIDILKDTSIGKFTKFTYPSRDSLITNYNTQISNKAFYFNYIANLNKAIRLNMTMRYDNFEYLFNNLLPIGTPSANNIFTQFTPKLGLTYNQRWWGGYVNYSKGFVPPQITEIYNAIRVPYLLPQNFSNIEIGSWYQSKKLSAEISIYSLQGKNEIISVRQTDGVNLNQNSGATSHIGIEYQVRYQLAPSMDISIAGSNTKHTYLNTRIKGVDVSGKEMNAAPNLFNNVSFNWKPTKLIRSSLEWIHQSAYYMDETNTTRYPGFNLLNARFGLQLKKSEIWLNVLNLTNTYYSTMATKNFSVKGSSAYSYYLGEPRAITIGWRWYIID
ncbi:MAG: TonB-dependent receptor plug domain-containing protein [Sediminibacterium sp.]|jgi:outer membrane receptor for Fe3+-dicitrate|nr:TonB-dependent receptor plug domain-containing protein [Sediminibacterium sp.]